MKMNWQHKRITREGDMPFSPTIRKTMRSAMKPFIENGLVPAEAWNEVEEIISETTGKLRRPELLTKAEVSVILKVTPRTIDNLMREKRLPFIKPTGKRIVRFVLSDVLKLLA